MINLSADDKVRVDDLTVAEQTELDELLAQLHAKTPRNRLRGHYYDMKNAVELLGVAIPPNFTKMCTVLGWAAKAVDILNHRCHLEGFLIPQRPDDDGVAKLWEDNRLGVEAPQVGTSTLIHAVSFLVVTEGLEGEPKVLISGVDGLAATGMWNRRARRLTSFLSVTDVDEDSRPSGMTMFLPDVNIVMAREGKTWTVDRHPHRFGVPVEPVVYQPRLSRTFGSSRISRAVMSLQDQAVRTAIRSEVSAELYSVPQRVLLGADETAFRNADGTVKTAWQAIMGRVWAIPDADEDGPNARADVKEFTSASQEPHVQQLRAWAQLFAGETSIPISSLGISSSESNPVSSEAYRASREDLILEAEATTATWSEAWRATMLRALTILNGWEDEIPDEYRGLQPQWRPANLPTEAARTDAVMKQIAAGVLPADSDVALEKLQYDATDIARIKAHRRTAGVTGAGLLDGLLPD